jgi:hypothetical protein
MKSAVAALTFGATTFIILATFILSAGCNKEEKKGGKPANIPYVKPPVLEITPPYLQSAAPALNALSKGQNLNTSDTLDVSEFKSRFFSPSPTEILMLLANIDSDIKDINRLTKEESFSCLSKDPVEHNFEIAGSQHRYYFQCARKMDQGDSFNLFGKQDNTWYFYKRSGQSVSAFKVTPNASDETKYDVDAYISVGLLNGVPNKKGTCGDAWDDCSYGLTHIIADSTSGTLQLTTGGIGIGYCGVQMISKGEQIFLTGSADGCTEIRTGCFNATTAEAEETCQLGSEEITIEPLGRAASTPSQHAQEKAGETFTWAAHPSVTNMILNGEADDSVHFGPRTYSEVKGISLIK